MTTNPASILDSVKKVLGFDAEYTAFDLDIIMHINSAFGSLQQLGASNDSGFVISDNTTLWTSYILDLRLLGLIQQYIYHSVRLAFDPPNTSFGLDAIQNQIAQLGWRINVAAEEIQPPTDPFDPDGIIMPVIFVPRVLRLYPASPVTPDFAGGNVFYLTLTGDTVINPPINAYDAARIQMELTSAGYLVTWPAGWNFGRSGLPGLSVDKTDIISAVYRASSSDWLTVFTPGF
jgi:hypothetical protein